MPGFGHALRCVGRAFAKHGPLPCPVPFWDVVYDVASGHRPLLPEVVTWTRPQACCLHSAAGFSPLSPLRRQFLQGLFQEPLRGA